MDELEVQKNKTAVAQNNMDIIKWGVRGPEKNFAKREYIEIKHNNVVELINWNEIELMKVESRIILTEFLTKPLSPKDFKEAVTRCDTLDFSKYLNIQT